MMCWRRFNPTSAFPALAGYHCGERTCPILASSPALWPSLACSSSAIRLEPRLRLRFSPASTTAAVRSTSSLKMLPARMVRCYSTGMSSDHKARPDRLDPLVPPVRKDLPVPLVPLVPRARRDRPVPRVLPALWVCRGQPDRPIYMQALVEQLDT